MASQPLSSLVEWSRPRWIGGSLGRAEFVPAAILLGCVLAYGLLMMLASGAALDALLPVAATFAWGASSAGISVLILYLCLCILRKERREDAAVRLFWLAVATAMTALTFPFYGLFKQLILPARGFIWDTTFAHVGRAMLGGTSPWVFTHALFGSVTGTRFLNLLYSGWLILIFAFPMVVATFVTDARLRLRLLACWFAAWVLIGTVAAWFFASAGPCYYNALVGHDESYGQLQRHLALLARQAAAEGHPIETLEFQPLLLKSFYARVLAPAGGISAMPSMHVALATLCAIAGFSKGRGLGIALTLYALLIWVGSVHFGWHYFVDGPMAAALMLAIWKGSGLILPCRAAVRTA